MSMRNRKQSRVREDILYSVVNKQYGIVLDSLPVQNASGREPHWSSGRVRWTAVLSCSSWLLLTARLQWVTLSSVRQHVSVSCSRWHSVRKHLDILWRHLGSGGSRRIGYRGRIEETQMGWGPGWAPCPLYLGRALSQENFWILKVKWRILCSFKTSSTFSIRFIIGLSKALQLIYWNGRRTGLRVREGRKKSN